jgi:hypothetical protein
MSTQFNEMSDKYATVLCTCKKVKERVKVLSKLLEIAEFSKDMGNFNGFMEIYSTLQRGPIRRLKKTFAVCLPALYFISISISIFIVMFFYFACGLIE